MDKLIYPELSYQIIGIAFDVFNQLGYGYQEKVYQKAISLELIRLKIPFKEQLRCNLSFNNEDIAKFFLDFLVDDRVVLELKVGKLFHKRNFDQILSYLKTNNLKLGLLILFTPNGIKHKRVLN